MREWSHEAIKQVFTRDSGACSADGARASERLFIVKRIVGIDAGVVKGANYAQIRTSSLMYPTDVERSLSRLRIVVAAWSLKNKEPIPYTPRSWD